MRQFPDFRFSRRVGREFLVEIANRVECFLRDFTGGGEPACRNREINNGFVLALVQKAAKTSQVLGFHVGGARMSTHRVLQLNER
jgi:hypothetical protein